MMSFIAMMRIKIIAPVKTTDPLLLVLHSMRVDHIQDDSDPHTMCCINEFHQFFWGTEAERWRKKVSHLIAK